jgi:hypothetical protein
MKIKYFTGNTRPDGSMEIAEARVIRTIRGRKSREDFIIKNGERIMHADVVEIVTSDTETSLDDADIQRLLAEIYAERE